MSNMVKIIIDDKEYEVPAGTNLVDAAKWYGGNDIPVFCYHPKMDPVGMCRMCLVEMGFPEKDRETGETVLDDDGNPKIRWFPKLQTACTQQVSDGMVIRTNSEIVDQSRENVVEFLLTSHPLDCPICDKGGECPLQNLTLEHGPGTSRMNYSDKMKLNKHVPLGDLIYLDQERCIQCARCIRFQDEIVGDDVLAFHERGRRLQIITESNPDYEPALYDPEYHNGFDTYFSGNTTDICPVGALTTEDFRFGARPWELTEVPSIDPYTPAGENISLSTRLDRDFGGKAIIKRVMPRQNEEVNEIWISDKVRFGHHFTRSDARLTHPLIRKGNRLAKSTWSEVLPTVAEVLKKAEGDVAAIAGSNATNEDLWELKQLLSGLGSERLGAWLPTNHTGNDIVAQVGVGKGTNLGQLGKGDAILVIASDLEEEVPMWRLRVKQAQDRGAFLVVANIRPTRMEELALETERLGKAVSGASIRYGIGVASQAMSNIAKDHKEIASKLADAENLVIIAGAEGLDLAGSQALMEACANFLIETKHVGKVNSGLLSTAPGPNAMGQHYLGFTPEATQEIIANPPKVLITLQAEVVDDDVDQAWLDSVETIISLSLFPDSLTEMADYALPVQSFAERDGTYTSGERRVQRFYTAQGTMGEAIPAWKAIAETRQHLEQGRAKISAAAVMLDITQNVPEFEGMRYKELARVERQYPEVGGEDLYYGGTVYQNKGGLGIQIPSKADLGEKIGKFKVGKADAGKNDKDVLVVPTIRLYNRQNMFRPSMIVHPRILVPYAELGVADAKAEKIKTGDVIEVTVGDVKVQVRAKLNASLEQGTVLLPRHLTDVATPKNVASGQITKIAEKDAELVRA